MMPLAPATKLVRVCAPHFTAGLDCVNGKCVEAAPILAWCKGRSENDLRRLFKRKGWHATVIDWRKHVVQL